jgi:hypothetical protein
LRVAPPLQTIAVGVIVERSKSVSQWSDFIWRPISVLVGEPQAQPWSKLSDDGKRTTFYAGAAEIELHRTETDNYRNNLMTETPLLWVALRPVDSDPPYRLFAVTADPAEGEALTEAGNDLIEPVPMPPAVQDSVAAFVSEHHVEHQFLKRQRDSADPEVLARGTPTRDDGKR